MFKVEGGIFKDTKFTVVEKGTEESYGPFSSYEEAHKSWMKNTFNSKLDTCCHRLFIKEING